MPENAQLTTPGPADTLPDRVEDAQNTVHEAKPHSSGTDAFAAFCREHAPHMIRFATFLLPTNRELAEEVVQDAFVEIWRRWGTIDRPAAYLRVAVTHKVIDCRRRSWRTTEYGLPNEAYDLPAPEAEEPEATILAAENSRRLLGALDEIPPKQREVLLLRYMWDLSIQEIANVTDSSPATVRSNIRHALRSLRGRYDSNPEQIG